MQSILSSAAQRRGYEGAWSAKTLEAPPVSQTCSALYCLRIYVGGTRRGMVAGLLSFQHNISVDNRIYWYPKRGPCDYLTVLCAFF